jgi:uncharacterized protein
MKKYLYLLFLGLLPFFALAQEMTADEKANAKNQVEDGENEAVSLLYKVSRDGGQPSYLFGTIHIISEELFEFPERYKERLSECEKIVLELDMDDPEMQTSMQQLIVAKDGETLDKLLRQEDYKKASAFFEEKLSMDLSSLNNLKPFFISSLMYPAMVEGKIVSYELFLAELAQEFGKEVEGLETIDFQVKIFDEIPAKEQAKMLMNMVTDFEKNQKIFADMVKFYKHNDPEVLYDFMIRNLEDYKKYKETLLDNRNQDWLQKISTMSQEMPCFFAVGAGHLGGEMGLINLLKQEGFKLEAID